MHRTKSVPQTCNRSRLPPRSGVKVDRVGRFRKTDLDVSKHLRRGVQNNSAIVSGRIERSTVLEVDLDAAVVEVAARGRPSG